MTQEEIIEMPPYLNASYEGDDLYTGDQVRELMKLVADKERKKSLKLWMLLDDIDTADDIAKSDDDIYRSLCRQLHKKRWDVLNGDEIDKAIKAREIA